MGYAAPGKAGVYNILIMEEKQTIMALGAGATTKFVMPKKRNVQGMEGADVAVYAQTGAGGERQQPSCTDQCPVRIERVENVKDVENYLSRVDEMIERKRKKMEEMSWD